MKKNILVLLLLISGNLLSQNVLERTRNNFDRGLTEVTDSSGKILLVSQKDVISPPVGKNGYKVNNGWKLREYTCSNDLRVLKDANYNMGIMNVVMEDNIDYNAIITIVRPFMSDYASIVTILENKVIKIFESELYLDRFCSAFINASNVLKHKP